MAERLYQDPFQQQQASPPMDLLDMLFAPSSAKGYAMGKPASEGLRDINPLNMLRQGSEQYGLTPWEQLFDPNSGQVTDVQGLLRSLNFAPVSRGIWHDEGEALPQYGGAGGGVEQALMNWLAGMGTGGGQQVMPGTGGLAAADNTPTAGASGAIAYDPSRLAYTSADLGGINLRDATIQDLDAWAQDQYGLDFLTMAAMGPQMLEARQRWMDDPSQWFDPSNPNTLDTTKIPGMNQADSAIRMAQYADAMQRQSAENLTRSQENVVGRQQQASMAYPQLGRTSLGAELGATNPMQMQLAQMMGAYQPPPMGYDYLLQRALLPQQLAQQSLFMGAQV